jgi:hypothetical protein
MQISLFPDKAEVGQTVYILGRRCKVTKKQHLDPRQNGGELYYTIHDPTGLGAIFTLSEQGFQTEEEYLNGAIQDHERAAMQLLRKDNPKE